MNKKEFVLGGQAVIEGVMMKGKNYYSISVRNIEKKIITKTFRIKHNKLKFTSWPVLRGIFTLFEILIIGIKSLIWSTNQQLEKDDKKEEMSNWNIFFSLFLSLGMTLIIFKIIPLLITRFIFSNAKTAHQVLFNFVDGIIRISIFVLYVYLLSLLKDIKMIFQYHGAEHKTIHCYEDKKKLTVKNVQKYKTIHPRCGTSFIFFVMLISIIIFSLVPIDLPFYMLLLFRILLILPIAGISYELLKFSNKFKNSFIFRILTYPGLLIQNITTKQPNNEQIEVAIESLKAIIKKERIN